jgi:hypothetical protein
MITTLQPTPMDIWRRRFSGRRRCLNSPRPLAALGALTHGPVEDSLVEVGKLTLVVLYDEPIGRGQYARRLAGYGGTAVPWGMKWGGPKQCRFFKDLLLQAVPGGRGRRLDAKHPALLRLGLQLDREIDRHVRYPHLPRRPGLRLPRLWAGFRKADVAAISAAGPEWEAYRRRTGTPDSELLTGMRRDHWEFAIYPLALVSHLWQKFAAVFADLSRFPRRQAFPLEHLPGGLIGFQDAAEYDFYRCRFRLWNTAPFRGNPRRAGLPAAV